MDAESWRRGDPEPELGTSFLPDHSDRLGCSVVDLRLVRPPGSSSPYWGHRLNTGLFDFRIYAHGRILEAGAGTERICPGSLTVDGDPSHDPDVVADLFHLPFDDQAFDLVIAHEVFCVYPLEQQLQLLAELWRVGRALYLRQWNECGWRILGGKCGFKFPAVGGW